MSIKPLQSRAGKRRVARRLHLDVGRLDSVPRKLPTGCLRALPPHGGLFGVRVMEEAFKGPYANQGPDLVVGFRPGWRVSWGGAMGEVGADVFDDNEKGWSGDHCVDESFVPGVLFSNLKLGPDAWIGDLAPTILDLFGIKPPPHMDGKVLAPEEDLAINIIAPAGVAEKREEASNV